MPVEMPRGLPFAVDTWGGADGKRHRFLTHAHRDHLVGFRSLSPSPSSHPIYATRVTIAIVRSYFPQIEEGVFVEIKVGETVVIGDEDGEFRVTACDANHCPGAVMFIFEGSFGNILHTGDCRLTHDCLQDLPLKYITRRGKEMVSRFDFVFLDCTFGRCFLKFPTKQSAIQQVINCIWKHPHAPFVYLACDLLGHEEILIEVSRTFGCKLFVDRSMYPDCFSTLSLTAPHIISDDPSSRFQVVGFQGLYQRSRQTKTNAQTNHQVMPLFIRPSTQWYCYASKTRSYTPILSKSVPDDFSVWHICFSIHSSREELELALQFLRPKWVISTTPPSLAMELSYVKKHCYINRWVPDDPLWKIFRVSFRKDERLSKPEELKEVLAAEVMEPIEIELEMSEPVTLFGRARFGMLDEVEIMDEEESEYISRDPCELDSGGKSLITEEMRIVEKCTEKLHVDEKENAEPKERCSEKTMENLQVEGREINGGEDTEQLRNEKKELDFGNNNNNKSCCTGSSNGLNKSLRQLYRSRNVPVPRPLPSLVDLLESSKRVKLDRRSSN